MEKIILAIKDVGIPAAILGYILWRGDYFLRGLIEKLDRCCTSMSNITLLMQDLIHYIKNGEDHNSNHPK